MAKLSGMFSIGLAGLGFLAASLAGISSADAQSVIGEAVEVDDTVTSSSSGRLTSRSSIRSNERIQSNNSGLGHFRFQDGTKMVVGPGTNMVLDENVYDPNQNKFKKFVITTTSGATRMITGNSDSSAFQIKTPVGILGIRGTTFEMHHYRGRTYVMILSGAMEVCSNTGNCKNLSVPCSFTMINSNGNILNPSQPRNGLFQSRDMARYFPFVNNANALNSDFQHIHNRCAGGNDGFGGGGTGKALPGNASPEPGRGGNNGGDSID